MSSELHKLLPCNEVLCLSEQAQLGKKVDISSLPLLALLEDQLSIKKEKFIFAYLGLSFLKISTVISMELKPM